MKKMKRFVAAFAATTVLMSCVPSMAWADSTTKTYNAINAQNTQFNKYLIMDENADVPIITFNYVITPLASKIDATATTLAVLPGITKTVGSVVYPKIDAVSFTADDSKSDTTEAGIGFIGYKQVVKPVVVDFSNIEFTEPGVYRYYIYEVDSDTSGISYDVKKGTTALEQKAKVSNGTDSHYYRTLDVYVEDDNNTGAENYSLRVTDYILYDGYITGGPSSDSTNQSADSAIDTTDTIVADPANGKEPAGAVKSDKYINYYDTKNLTIGKRVTGNQGSRDKYFKFTVDITGLTAGTLLGVDISGAEATVTDPSVTQTYIGRSNLKQIISGNEVDLQTGNKLIAQNDGTVKYVCYLKNNQYITINGLPTNSAAKYSITEDKEDYTESYYGDITGNGKTDLTTFLSNGTVSTGMGDAKTAEITEVNVKESAEGLESNDIEYAFLNEKNGVIPTGIIMSVAPAVIVGIGVLAAIFALVLGGKKKELDEE